MQIAKLNQRVELLQPILSSDGYGGYATNYKKVISLWAEVKDSRYSEKQAFDTPNALSNITLKTRTYIHSYIWKKAGIFYGRAENMKLLL